MLFKILDRLVELLGPIATSPREQRDKRNSALSAISIALNETWHFYQDFGHDTSLSADKNRQLALYWTAAAVSIRYFDHVLAELVEEKPESWISPDVYTPLQVEELSAKLEGLAQAYRRQVFYVPRRVPPDRPARNIPRNRNN